MFAVANQSLALLPFAEGYDRRTGFSRVRLGWRESRLINTLILDIGR